MSGFLEWRGGGMCLLFGFAVMGLAAASPLPKTEDAILLNNSELVDLFQNSSLTRALVERHSFPADAVAQAVSLTQEYLKEPRTNDRDSLAVGKSRESDYGRQISEVFSPEERIGLRRWYWLELGADALATDHVAQVLKLRTEQVTRLRELRERFDRELQSEINNLPRVSADYFQQVRNAHRAKKLAATMEVLSAEQRALWTELTEARK